MNTKVAVVLLLVGVAEAQWGGVTGNINATTFYPRIPTSACPGVTLLPLRTTPIVTDATSRVFVSVEAWCGGNPRAELAAVTDCGSKQWWHLADDRDEVSTLEATLTIEVEPGAVQTLLLIDLSNSVQQQTPLNQIKAGVKRYINYAYDRLAQTGPHMMSIYTFDERRQPQLTQTWTNNRQTLLAAVDKIVCGQETFPGSGIRYCSHSSTNLYGSLVFSARELERQMLSSNNIRRTSRGYDSAILVFTDGEDLAALESHITARSEITRVGAILFAVGVRANANNQFGPTQQLAAMRRITLDNNAAFIADSFATVPATYDLASARLIAYFSRSYRLSYCSPRRARSHSIEVKVRQTAGSTVLGPRSEFIRGQRVRYTQNTGTGVAGLIRDDGLITEVLPPNNQFTFYRYRVTFPSATNVPAVVATPTELDMIYGTTGFGPSFTCLASNTVRTQTCAIPTGALAPFTCTGGGLYNCGSKRCDCAVGSCGDNTNNACFNRVQSMTPPLYVNRECPNGLPAAPLPVTSFTRSTDSTLSMVFTASCADGSSIGGLTFSPCSDLSSITILESRENSQFQPISLYESRPRITCVPKPAHLTSLMLLDMSGSIMRGYGGLQRLKEFAVAYLRGVTSDLTSHVVSVYTFDGQNGVRLLTGFGTSATAITAIQNLDCGSNRCLDPSSNVNGAIVEGNQLLNAYHAANPRSTDGTGRQPFLALFSDGADQAQRFTDAEAVASATNGTGIFAIGLQGEPRADPIQRGVDIQRLTNIARNSVYVVGTAAELQTAFKQVGSGISSAAASSYRLDYCSPKRSGTHRVRIQLTHYNSVTYWEQEFDANFDCSGQACNRCLAGGQQDFSCAVQPGPANQNFACTNNQLPISVDGYCRCPCPNPTQYPPSTQAGPGPIVCEKQGTCSRGEPVSCTTHGGLNRTVQTFTRFGASSNSRVSMEFVPSCADGWPIPALKMSVCDSLSSFRVYETDSTGVSVPISKFESEPRISCFPDVVSLILLDTSGSITGGNTEAALKAAVISYLQTMEARLQVTHTIGIYAFDGRAGVLEIQPFTSNYQTSIATMNAWSCALGNFCGVDPSTNLYGAMITAEQMIRATAGNFTWRQRPYLVVFTDGTDQAARATEAQAISVLAQGTTDYNLRVYGVGIEGERQNGKMGLSSGALARLAPAGAFLAADSTGVTAEFTRVANQIIALTQESDTTRYRLDYCSPKRAGLTTVTVELVHEGQVARYSTQFDASQFQCDGNSDLCASCLSRRVYSCVNQPQSGPGGGEQQFFQCQDGRSPVNVNNLCKCPCDGTYPPDPTPIPTNSPSSLIQVGTPTFSPTSGSYANAVTVTIAGETGATIYYTTDGSTPTTSSTRYIAPFTWNAPSTTTVRAIAMIAGRPNSLIGSATYTLGNVITTPTPGTGACASFGLTGFTSTILNGNYQSDARVTNGFPTYWSSNGRFIYRCADGYYYITLQSDYSASIAAPCRGTARSMTLASNSWQQALSSSWVPAAVVYTCGGGVFTPTPGVIITPMPGFVITPNPLFGTPIPTTFGAPTGVVARPSIQLGSDALRRSNNVPNVITGITPGASAHCTASVPGMFQGVVTANVINGVASLVMTPLMTGTSQLTCTLLRNSLLTQLTPITVNVASGRFTSMRIALRRTLATFDTNSFIAAIRSLVGNNVNVILRWVCPERHCWGKTVCTPQAPTCNIITTSRSAAVMQSDDVVYVDFDLAGYNDAQLETARNAINTDVDKCWRNEPCTLGGQNVDRKAVLVGNNGQANFGNTRSGSSGDDSLATWEWVLIIAGCVLFCILLIVIIACLCKGKKKKQKEQQFDDVAKSEEMRPHSTAYSQSPAPRGKSEGEMAETSYYEDSYSSPGSQSQSYYSTSYAPEKFDIDEQVKALYVDGQWYDAKIWSQADDGTYEVQWYDGQHSDGIPGDQIKRA